MKAWLRCRWLVVRARIDAFLGTPQLDVVGELPNPPMANGDASPRASRDASPRASPAIRGALYRWRIERQERRLHVALVEVGRYDPPTHAEIFTAALNALTKGEIEATSSMHRTTPAQSPGPLDLAVFPEAFLPTPALLKIFRSYTENGAPAGLVHVGLRGVQADTHLLSKTTLDELVGTLQSESLAHDDDLRGHLINV